MSWPLTDAGAKLGTLRRLKEAWEATGQSPSGVEAFVTAVVPPLLRLLEAMRPQQAGGPVHDVRHALLELLSKVHVSLVSRRSADRGGFVLQQLVRCFDTYTWLRKGIFVLF